MPRAAGPSAATAHARRPKAHRAGLDEAPKAAWHPVPLTEVVILIGIVLLVIGFVSEDQPVTLALGFGLTALASGELAAREHFAGYRSHSSLLAGLVAVILCVVLVLAGVPSVIVLAVGVAVGALTFTYLRSSFKQAAGVAFRV